MTDPRCADCKFWERRHRSDWTHNQNAYGECQWIGPPIIQFLLDLPVVEEAISNLIGSPRSCHENYSCSMFEPRTPPPPSELRSPAKRPDRIEKNNDPTTRA